METIEKKKVKYPNSSGMNNLAVSKVPRTVIPWEIRDETDKVKIFL